MPDPETPMPNAGGATRRRDFRLVAGSVALSAFGDWVAIVALGLAVKQTSGSGFVVAALWICLFGPSVALAGHGGLLVDRIETTRLLAAVSAAGAVAAACLAFTTATIPLLALTAVLGIVFAISQPAEASLVPLLTDEGGIQKANGHMETARYLGFGLGPLAGGALYSVGGIELAMLVDAATFAAVGIAALSLRVRRHPEPGAEGEPQRAREGIAYLFGNRLLDLTMVVAFVSLTFMSAIWVAELFFVEDVLGEGDLAYGLMLSIWTLGMAAGAMLIARRIPAALAAGAGLAAVAIQGAALGLPALWLSLAFFFGCALLGGLAHGVKNVMFRSLIHVHVPERVHGRAFSAYNGLRNTAELAAFAAGGILVTAIGAQGTLLYAGGLSGLAGVIGVLVWARLYAAGSGAGLALPRIRRHSGIRNGGATSTTKPSPMKT